MTEERPIELVSGERAGFLGSGYVEKGMVMDGSSSVIEPVTAMPMDIPQVQTSPTTDQTTPPPAPTE